jgi:hypothetical protein
MAMQQGSCRCDCSDFPDQSYGSMASRPAKAADALIVAGSAAYVGPLPALLVSELKRLPLIERCSLSCLQVLRPRKP